MQCSFLVCLVTFACLSVCCVVYRAVSEADALVDRGVAVALLQITEQTHNRKTLEDAVHDLLSLFSECHLPGTWRPICPSHFPTLSLSLCNGHVVIMHLLGPVARWTSILSIDQHMRTLLEVLLRQQSSDRAICDVCEILRLCKNNGPVLSCFSSRKGGCE